jgi:serine/threonine protein kinase
MPALESLPSKIGPYRPIEKIGEGGMGVVYLARDPEGRQVAIKVLGPAVASDPDARLRLAREVETMRRVHSRHVAEILAADINGPAPYIATRFVPGRTLEATVQHDGALPPDALDHFAAGLAQGLAAIHAAGVVHRDLKPGNVMVDAEGHPVIIDFGIAHVPDSARLTRTGLVMGTPGYLAPEVIEGAPASGASDVHSWGATVAYAATGRQPFGSGTYQTIFFRVIEGKAELDGVPPRLLPYVAGALARNPAARPTAWELAAQLALPPREPFLSGTSRTRVDYPPSQTQADYPSRLAPPTRLDPLPQNGPLPPVSARPQPSAWSPASAVAASGAGLAARPRYLSPAEAAADVADLLPPVAAAPARPKSQYHPASPALGMPAQPDWQPSGIGFLSLAAGVGAVALSVLLPVAGTILVLAVITLLRAVDLAQTGLAERRSMRGARPSDLFIVIVTAPLTVLRAALKTVLLAPLAIIVAALAAAASVAFARSGTLPSAGSWAAGAAIALYCVGPGSRAPRWQLRKLAGGIHTRTTFVAIFIAVWAFALAIVTSALSQPPLIWPATASTIPHLLPGLPSLGGALHSVQQWLLRNTVGMLHLP